MKLIMENWRQFLKEESGVLNQQGQRLLSMLINMKKFNNVEDFLNRVQFVKHKEDYYVRYVLKIDNKVAGTASYERLEKRENCRPAFKSGNQPKGTMVLARIARESEFKGWGVGRLLSFLSACDINYMGLSITSDRNTSDKAGKQLVNTLKMMGAQTSESFDYVGWFISMVKKAYHDYDTGEVSVPFHTSSDRSGVKGEKERGKMRAKLNKQFDPAIKKLLKHLKPLTPQEDDDCEPSANIVVGSDPLKDIIKGPKFLDLINKFLKMSNKEVNQFFNSDPRVQGYTFVMPSKMLKYAQEIIKAIDITSNLSDDDLADTLDQGDDMFGKIYGSEIGALGKAVGE